jgi:hypothetical protein
MSKLNRDDVLFMCFGIAEKGSRIDMSDTDTFLDRFVRVEGVDFASVDGVSADMAREWIEDAERIEGAKSFGGTPGAAGRPGSGLSSTREVRLGSSRSELALALSGSGWEMTLAEPDRSESEALLLFRVLWELRAGSSRLSCKL